MAKKRTTKKPVTKKVTTTTQQVGETTKLYDITTDQRRGRVFIPVVIDRQLLSTSTKPGDNITVDRTTYAVQYTTSDTIHVK